MIWYVELNAVQNRNKSQINDNGKDLVDDDDFGNGVDDMIIMVISLYL